MRKLKNKRTKKTLIATLNLHQDMTSKIILDQVFLFFLCLYFEYNYKRTIRQGENRVRQYVVSPDLCKNMDLA